MSSLFENLLSDAAAGSLEELAGLLQNEATMLLARAAQGRRRDAWRRYSWLAAGGVAIHIAGDSTAAAYKMNRYPQSGWGQFLGCALDETIAVRNHAIGGRSTKTFIEEGRLELDVPELGEITTKSFIITARHRPLCPATSCRRSPPSPGRPSR